MSDYIGVVTNAGQAKIAAALGGTALNLTTIRVGDGNGAPIVPNPAMADLVRRVGAAYPIISSGRDPVNASHWRVTALIPAADGPFDIREIGVFDAAGEMIAVAKHVFVEKRSPAQGAAVELLTDIVFPVSETAQVTVQVTPSAQISIFQMLRAGFCVVESATVADPPGAPALGRTHVVPAGATGAWAGLAGMLVQWNGIVWVAVNAPLGHIVVDQSKDAAAPQSWLRRVPAGWASAAATTASHGPTRLATIAETRAGLLETTAITPAGLSGAVRRRATNTLTFYVRPGGDDAHDGLENTDARAFRTVQAAVDNARTLYDPVGWTVLIKLGVAGEYTGTVSVPNVGAPVVIEGALASQDNFTIQAAGAVGSAIVAAVGGDLTLRGLRVLNNGSGAHGIAGVAGARVLLENVTSSASVLYSLQSHVASQSSAEVLIGHGCRITNDMSYAWLATTGSILFLPGVGATFTNGITFYRAVAAAHESGSIRVAAGVGMVGSVNGKRFEAALNGTINTNGAGVNFFPGTVPGTEETGGHFV